MMVALARAQSTNLMVSLQAPSLRYTSLIMQTAGYTYCAIAALAILDRLRMSQDKMESHTLGEREAGLTNVSGTIRWLLSRQLAYSAPEDSDDATQFTGHPSLYPPIVLEHSHHETEIPPLADPKLDDPMSVGFNGRMNKEVDTCYCFWVSGALEVY